MRVRRNTAFSTPHPMLTKEGKMADGPLQVIKPGELRAEVVPSGQFGFKIHLFQQGRKRPIGVIQPSDDSSGPLDLRLAAGPVARYLNDGAGICLVQECSRRRSRAKELLEV